MVTERQKAISVLTMNTVAFMVCFACWVLYGVLVTFLVDNGIYAWDKGRVGLLIGTPVLTGSLLRLPLGVLTDKYGGRPVFVAVMLLSALAMYSVSYADSFAQFMLAGLGFGLTGASFAVGVAYTSMWFPPNKQGTALGVFGAGNTGAALTSIFAPMLLVRLTDNMAHLENWRLLPKLYAALLVATTVLFLFFTYSRKIETEKSKSILQRLEPLKQVRVWRFGLYYFLVFGGFVALSQWLIPYYLNVYTISLATAGLMAAAFSLPAGLIRCAGGWMSDKWGARSIMYMVLSGCIVCGVLLSVPRVNIESPGEGILSKKAGVVTAVTPNKIVVDGNQVYPLSVGKSSGALERDRDLLIWPVSSFSHRPVVSVGDHVGKKSLLARGITRIHFQANMWIFTGLVFVLGITMGVGSAAVFRYIPDYFAKDIGVVGGIVGVLGGLGGFFCPIIFGYLLKATGIWTTCWLFLAVLATVCLAWMHYVITRMMHRKVPELMQQMEEKNSGGPAPAPNALSPQTESTSDDPLPETRTKPA